MLQLAVQGTLPQRHSWTHGDMAHTYQSACRRFEDGCFVMTVLRDELHARAPEEVFTPPQLEATAEATMVERARVPPPLAVPPGLTVHGRTWSSGTRLGCSSHVGPKTQIDKGNEDFAFATECSDHRGAPWLLAGVCDGVSQSAWSERGAQHAANAFIEVVRNLLLKGEAPSLTMQSPEAKASLARAFRARVLQALTHDATVLCSSDVVAPGWRRAFYERKFITDDKATEARRLWLQSTLLGVALGPEGGFALLLGDGYVRIDRYRDGRLVERKVVPPQRDESQPELSVSLLLEESEVRAGIRGILPQQADEIAVVLATDGVSKSPDHGLDDVELDGTPACAAFLEQLAARPNGHVESDNMSVAFARRRIGQLS